MTDLQRLIEAVERGTFLMDVLPDGRTERIAYDAFSGSLDAAKALHEALLPHNAAVLDIRAGKVEISRQIHDDDGNWLDEWEWDFEVILPGLPARAWLIAVLRAVEAGR